MNEALEDRVTELANSMDPKCFRGATPGYVADHHDARIVCESMVLGASWLNIYHDASMRPRVFPAEDVLCDVEVY